MVTVLKACNYLYIVVF